MHFFIRFTKKHPFTPKHSQGCFFVAFFYKGVEKMSRKNTRGQPKKMGRPEKKIDKIQFEELCKMQCTEKEICAVLNVTVKTLNKWCKATYDNKTFSNVFEQKRSGGKASLRRYQWQQAETNPTMAIWLGKQYLDQKDSAQQVKMEGELKTNNPFEGISTADLLKMREKLAKDDG